MNTNFLDFINELSREELDALNDRLDARREEREREQAKIDTYFSKPIDCQSCGGYLTARERRYKKCDKCGAEYRKPD